MRKRRSRANDSAFCFAVLQEICTNALRCDRERDYWGSISEKEEGNMSISPNPGIEIDAFKGISRDTVHRYDLSSRRSMEHFFREQENSASGRLP